MGYTPLHQAAQQGHVLVINLLLKNNASPNTLNEVSASQLHCISWCISANCPFQQSL